MSQIVYKKGHVVIVRCFTSKRKARKNSHGVKSTSYFTIVNTKTRTHCHVYNDELTAAKMIANHAVTKTVPERYPQWMKDRIRRIM